MQQGDIPKKVIRMVITGEIVKIEDTIISVETVKILYLFKILPM